MRRWVPRPIDLAVAAVLTVATQVELWLLAPPGVPLGAVAASFAVGTPAFAWHRLAPLAALTVGLTGLAVVPGALGVDPALAFGWFVTAFALMASAGYHARRPVLALAISFALLALEHRAAEGPGARRRALRLAARRRRLAGGPGGRPSRTLRAELSEQRAARAEDQAQWRAAAAVAEERLRIAREMHDVVSHSVSVMTLHAGGVRRLLRPDQVEERAALETVERTGRESLAEMHRMLGRPARPGRRARRHRRRASPGCPSCSSRPVRPGCTPSLTVDGRAAAAAARARAGRLPDRPGGDHQRAAARGRPADRLRRGVPRRVGRAQRRRRRRGAGVGRAGRTRPDRDAGTGRRLRRVGRRRAGPRRRVRRPCGPGDVRSPRSPDRAAPREPAP